MKKFCCLVLLGMSLLACKKTQVSATTTPPADTTTTNANQITFSGLKWTVKQTGNGTEGPGPNYWTADNAFVDTNGFLHLKLTKINGKWYCGELTSVKSFGYGTYQWDIEGRTDTLDKNVVLGLFNYSGVDGYDEMDIEYAKFGNAAANNTSFTIYPAQNASSPADWHTTYNTALTGTYTTSRFTRTSSSVYLQELGGFQTGNANLLASATCNNPPNSISTLAMPVHMNLWLFQGTAPMNNSQVEIIIHSFTFTPQ